MLKFKLVGLIFFGVLFFLPFSSVKAQEEKPLQTEQTINKNSRPSLLSELDLTAGQIRDIRRINRENRPLRRLAQQRLRQANRDLDEAIYADNLDDAEIRLRVAELQNAQIKVIKARSTSELAVRGVLTGRQLAKFRELRRKFMENNEMRPNRRRRNLGNFSNRRLNNRQRQSPAPNN